MNSKPWSDFSLPRANEWEEAARQELNGEEPLAKLSVVKGNIKILPYYAEQNDRPTSIFSLQPASESFLGARSWYNTPKILVADEKTANQQALAHLNLGADGIAFAVSGEKNISDLFAGIDLRYCLVVLQGEISAATIAQLEIHLTKQYGSTESANLLVFPSSPDSVPLSLINYPGVRPLGISVEEKSSTEETIAHTLNQVVATIERVTAQGASIEKVFNAIALSVSVGTDFFNEVAKLKVVRTLCRLIAIAYHTPASTIHIHATSPAWINPAYQPHGNLIKSTTASLSAVLGGCDSLTVESEDETPTTQRVARNLSLLLREESQLARVADPTEGSYYIESLCKELSEKSWALFLQLQK